MNYEKFNDAMCRLRQSEEDFNKAIQDIQTGFNEYEKELAEKTKQTRSEDLQAQIDEAYNKGMQDLHDALSFFSEPIPKMREIFGSVYIEKIIQNYSPKEIIDKVNQWKAKEEQREQELHVGDEVIADYGIVGIITDVGDGNGIVWVTYRLTPSARGFDFCWANSAKCKKTGRHFDSIPFDYNSEKEEENK